MLLLAIIFGIWGILVFFTPIGIWNAKGRISALEKQVWELKGLLKSQSNGGQYQQLFIYRKNSKKK